MIVFSDLHLKEESEETVFSDVLPGLMDALSTANDRLLVCLGDFWHLRYQVSVRLQNRVFGFFQHLNKLGISIVLVPGNHDQINVQGENALQVFAALPNVVVCSEPQWTTFGLCIPYRKNKADIQRALMLPRPGKSFPKIVWMHQGVKGALLTGHIEDTTGLDRELFADWKVFCGHYHRRQQVGNVFYVGSTHRVSADDAGPKGYVIVDSETGEHKEVTTNWGKEFYNLGTVDLNAFDFSEAKAGDEIRATIPKGVDVTGVVKSLNERGIKCIATPEIEIQEQRLDVANANGLIDYVHAYVNEFAGNMDKEKLIAMYQAFVSEAGK